MRELEDLETQIIQLNAAVAALEALAGADGLNLAPLVATLESELETYRSFDPLHARAELAIRQTELAQLEPELARCRARKQALDSEIAAPWQALQARHAKCAAIERDLRKAERFDAQLGAAGSNRAAIHQACRRELGDSKPHRVIESLGRKLEFEKREILKLEQRIEEAVRKSQLDVRELIIDGSNMLRQGGREFIGLRTLEAVMPALTAKYEVTVNFDPGVRRRLEMNSADIEARLAGARVYFLQRGMKADPFVLRFVEDKPHAYVISNDNFRDYAEKPAVQQRRILKHAILNDRVEIPALDISVPLG